MSNFPQTSMAGGELAPALRERPDLSRYQVGLSTCRNWFIHPEGGSSNRAGTKFVVETKTSSKASVLIPFEFNDEDSYALEFGDEYMRVVRDGGQVLLPSTPAAYNAGTTYAQGDHVSYSGVNYYSLFDGNLAHQPDITPTWWYSITDDVVEIPTPYQDTEVGDVQFVQSADIITLVHPNHPPKELSRTDHHVWKLNTITFAPDISAPTNAAVSSQTVGAGSTPRSYVITAYDEESGEESVASSSADTTTDTDANWVDGEYIRLTWDTVTGATKYNVYKEENGIYGFIGATEDLTFDDTKITPDLGDTPPKARNPFSGAGNYPAAVTYYEQRLVFGGMDNNKQGIEFSQTGRFHNMSRSSPQKPDDAISVTIDASQVNVIRHLVPLDDLLVLTSGAIHKITSGDNAFSFDNMRRRPQGGSGAAKATALIIEEECIYVQSRGSRVKSSAYDLERDGYKGKDRSVMSSHLFKDHQIVRCAYSEEPDNIMWAIRDDGVLLGLTYLKEHDVWGWHRHDTDGEFESLCVIPEGQYDALYVVVKRTINGGTKRYIERLDNRTFTDIEDAFFVDSGLTYSGVAADTITGLDHLEGKSVAILADGSVHPQQTVVSGQITLQLEVTKAHIGLPIEADLESLEPPIPNSHGNKKTVSQVRLRVIKSRGAKVGPDSDTLKPIKQRQYEAWGDPTEMKTGELKITLDPTWRGSGKVFIRQSDPLPFTILAMIPDVEVGS